MKFLSYDIEIYDELPKEGDVDFTQIRPSVAAFCTTVDDAKYFYDEPYMSVDTAKKLVKEMMAYVENGYKIFTWNGTSFDFQLLAVYSGMIEECSRLALEAYDGMLMVTFQKGYYLGLEKALVGARLDTKLHTVTLNDGTVMEDMSGIKAPELWKKGEFKAVMDYLHDDVVQPLKLVQYLEENPVIRWTSNTGKPMTVYQKLEPVKNLFNIKVPDTSWMTEPPKSRGDFIKWMTRDVLKEYKLIHWLNNNGK